MPDRQLPPPTAPGPLLPWLVAALAPTNRTRVKQLLQHGRIVVNGRVVTRHDHALAAGDHVAVAAEGTTERPDATPPLIVQYEDPHLIIVDKPAGLLSVATDTEKGHTAFSRLSAMLTRRKAGRPFVVHRLDRGTSGLLVFARSAKVRDAMQANWDTVRKTYVAVVEGTPRPAEGTIENHLLEGDNLRVRPAAADTPGAKHAVTEYKTDRASARNSLVYLVIRTGRKHQIRVHLAGLGCPVVGDRDYGAKTDPVGRVCLHALSLGFDHPITGKRVQVHGIMPADLWTALGPATDQRLRIT